MEEPSAWTATDTTGGVFKKTWQIFRKTTPLLERFIRMSAGFIFLNLMEYL
jgi:hypothetical protein